MLRWRERRLRWLLGRLGRLLLLLLLLLLQWLLGQGVVRERQLRLCRVYGGLHRLLGLPPLLVHRLRWQPWRLGRGVW